MDMGNVKFYYGQANEAIHKTKAARRWQMKATEMVWERARVEFLYVKSLQEWIEKYEPLSNSGAFEYNSDIRNLYQFPCDEARVLAELHQLVYNQLMSSQGPYSKLTKNGEHIEKGYAAIKLHRRNLVDRKKAAYKKYQNVASQKAACEALLNKETPTGRINRFNKSRIDALEKKCKQLEEMDTVSWSRYEDASRNVNEYDQQSRETVSRYLDELQSIEANRISHLTQQLKAYATSMEKLADNEKGRKRQMYLMELMHKCDKIKKDDVTAEWRRQIDTEVKAKREERSFSVVDLLRIADSSMSNRRSDTATPSGDSYSTPQNVRVVQSIDSSRNDVIPSACSLFSAFYDTSQESLSENEKPQLNGGQSKANDDYQQSESSIEEISVGGLEDMKSPSQPFATKEFCVGPCDGGDNDDRDRSEVSQCENKKVYANRDYKSKRPEELTLYKGQLIKQKRSADANGMAYGWIRPNKLSKKCYGFYPATYVK